MPLWSDLGAAGRWRVITEARPDSHLFELAIFFRQPTAAEANKVERRLRWFLRRFGRFIGLRGEWAMSSADLIPTKRMGSPRGFR